MELEKFHYDNRSVKWFAYATIFWSIVGMLAGLWASIALFYPQMNLGLAVFYTPDKCRQVLCPSCL